MHLLSGHVSPETATTTRKRERSTIQFPYNDLDDAIIIAKAVHENAGLSCTIDQLAAYVKNSLTSGAFRLRAANAAIFGLTENERGEVRLTPLGRRIADASQEAAAKVAATRAAAWDAEQNWQFDRLVLWLSDEEPEDWPLP